MPGSVPTQYVCVDRLLKPEGRGYGYNVRIFVRGSEEQVPEAVGAIVRDRPATRAQQLSRVWILLLLVGILAGCFRLYRSYGGGQTAFEPPPNDQADRYCSICQL